MANAAIEQLILKRAGLHPESIGSGNIAHAVEAAMARAGLRDEAEYLDLLKASAAELQALIDALVITETWFFRDSEPFVFLNKYVQTSWLPIHAAERLRVLSIPCSTGEEPYSIALTLLEAGLKPEQFHIDAADISADAIAKARRACYRERAFRGKLAEWHARYFRSTDEGMILDRRVAEMVNFHVDNLVHPSYLASQEPYHVVFCRNMVIYLSAEARELVLKSLARLIVPRGILFAGHSEVAFFQQAGYTPVSHARSFACEQGVKAAGADVAFAEQRIASERDRTKARRAPPAVRKAPAVVPSVAPAIPGPARAENSLDDLRRLADRGQLERARAMCEQYLRDRPSCAEAHCLLGLIHQASDRPDEAEACYAKAVYLDPNCVEALVHLGLCRERRGDPAGAALIRERARRIEMAITG